MHDDDDNMEVDSDFETEFSDEDDECYDTEDMEPQDDDDDDDETWIDMFDCHCLNFNLVSYNHHLVSIYPWNWKFHIQIDDFEFECNFDHGCSFFFFS